MASVTTRIAVLPLKPSEANHEILKFPPSSSKSACPREISLQPCQNTLPKSGWKRDLVLSKSSRQNGVSSSAYEDFDRLSDLNLAVKDEEDGTSTQESSVSDTELQQVLLARELVSDLIKSGDKVEERIVEYADRGELTESVLRVIRNRYELAREDNEKDVMQAMDLLFRRIQSELESRQATPSMRLLNELLNLQDGVNDNTWHQNCQEAMRASFCREDVMADLTLLGIDLFEQHGPVEIPKQDPGLLRIDFIREVDELLAEVEVTLPKVDPGKAFAPEEVAAMLQYEEKLRAVQQVRDIRQMAVDLEWY